ncbi:MAG: peroxiredoxin family protein [Gammaproteobacteria bacterium]|nr:peroxiredoxin family protein [Gammaproteobacteria bacterium]
MRAINKIQHFTKLIFLPIFMATYMSAVNAALPKPGDTAPEFKLKALDGNYYTLSGMAKKGHVMLVFWEPNCVYCYSHISDFNALQKKYKGKLTIAAINFLGEYEVEVREYAESNNVKYLMLAERLNGIDVAEAYKVIGSPTIVMIGPNKKILYYGFKVPDVGKWLK